MLPAKVHATRQCQPGRYGLRKLCKLQKRARALRRQAVHRRIIEASSLRTNVALDASCLASELQSCQVQIRYQYREDPCRAYGHCQVTAAMATKSILTVDDDNVLGGPCGTLAEVVAK
jgi:hypothetical protein